MVTDEERDYMYRAVRGRSADAAERRHPPPARAVDGEQPPAHRADEQPAVLVARHADHLLRRRDRDGRQHLSRRSQRRPHADAVEQRPQRRLLPRRPGPAVRAADHGSGLRLPGDQRRGPGAISVLAPQLDEARSSRCAGSIASSAAARSRSIPLLNRKVARLRASATIGRRSSASPTCRDRCSRSNCDLERSSPG